MREKKEKKMQCWKHKREKRVGDAWRTRKQETNKESLESRSYRQRIEEIIDQMLQKMMMMIKKLDAHECKECTRERNKVISRECLECGKGIGRGRQ